YFIIFVQSKSILFPYTTIFRSNAFVTSTSAYNDGKWHYAVATYDGSVVRLYIDGLQVKTLSTTLIPDNTGTQPLRIGANSLALRSEDKTNELQLRVHNISIIVL